MDYSPWSSKNLSDRNRLKKFMQVLTHFKCMHTNFGWCDLFGFGDIDTFKNGQISLSSMVVIAGYLKLIKKWKWLVSIMIHVMCHIKIYDNAIQADLPGTVTRRCWHSLSVWSDTNH